MREGSRKREVRLSTKDIKKKTKSSEKLELKFVGTPRCGMNCIAHWIMEHYQGYGFHLDKPITTVSKDKTFYSKLVDSITNSKKNLVVRNRGNNICVGYGFQSASWTKFFKAPTASKNFLNIMILRDPFNQMGSIEKYLQKDFNRNLTAREYILWRSIWIEHAKSFIKYPFRNGDTIRILYNQWCTDEKYRIRILSELGKGFTTEDVSISKPYTKSPFTSSKFLKRHREMRDSHPIQASNRDAQLKKLSEKIFK